MSDQPKKPDTAPPRPAAGQGPRPPETTHGDPKEKEADAPATSENEQKAARASKGAGEEKEAAAKTPLTPDGQLHPDLQRIQAQHAEGPPEPKKLVRPGKEDGVPKAETPKAPRADSGDVPRFIHENERAPRGLVRVKVRCTNYGVQDTRYVLARDEAEAKGHYLHALAIDRMAEAMGEGAPEPLFAVTKLAD